MPTEARNKWMFIVFLALLILLAPEVSSDASSSATVLNSAPVINSINAYASYTSDAENMPQSNFILCGNGSKTVYIQVNATDANDYQEVSSGGYVSFKIVKLDGSTESSFTRFGDSFVNATLESGSGSDMIYNASFDMLANDSAPLYYRIRAKAYDGTDLTNASANFSYSVMSCVNATNYTVTSPSGTLNASDIFLTLLGSNFTGDVSIIETASSPVNFTSFGKTAVAKFYSIFVSSNITEGMTSGVIRIYYTAAEISTLDEASLRVYTYTGSSWAKLNNSGVNTTANYAYGDIEHFSLFAIFGDEPSSEEESEEESSGGGGGGGGSSGGGISVPGSPPADAEEGTEPAPLETDDTGTIPDLSGTIPGIPVPAPEAPEPLFDILVEIPEGRTTIYPGGKLLSTIKLVNIGSAGRIDVYLDYRITDAQDNIILKKRETVAVETQTSFVRTFEIPTDLPPGIYHLEAALTYFNGKTAASRHSFIVTEPGKDLDMELLILAGILTAALLTLFIIKKGVPYYQEKRLESQIRKMVKKRHAGRKKH